MVDISKWGLANKRLVFLLVVILTLGGIVSYYKMPLPWRMLFSIGMVSSSST